MKRARELHGSSKPKFEVCRPGEREGLRGNAETSRQSAQSTDGGSLRRACTGSPPSRANSSSACFVFSSLEPLAAGASFDGLPNSRAIEHIAEPLACFHELLQALLAIHGCAWLQIEVEPQAEARHEEWALLISDELHQLIKFLAHLCAILHHSGALHTCEVPRFFGWASTPLNQNRLVPSIETGSAHAAPSRAAPAEREAPPALRRACIAAHTGCDPLDFRKAGAEIARPSRRTNAGSGVCPSPTSKSVGELVLRIQRDALWSTGILPIGLDLHSRTR
jgi:hypothetical protein